MTSYFNSNNSEISKELLVNKFNMILNNQGRLVLNHQKVFSPYNKIQRSPGFLQKQPPGVFCKKGVLKNLANFLGVSFRPATLIKRDSNIGVFL